MKRSFSRVEETALIETFVDQVHVRGSVPAEDLRGALRRFCRQYRTMDRGVSFLNEAESARWLVLWRDQYLARGRSPHTLCAALGRAQRWTEHLFAGGVLDDDVLSYLRVPSFVRDKQAPPHLSVNLQRCIQMYVDGWSLPYTDGTVRMYCGVLHGFNGFQNAWSNEAAGWERLQNDGLIVAWLQDLRERYDERNAAVRLRVLRDFLEHLRVSGHLTSNAADELYRRCPRKGWRGLARAASSEEPASALESLRPVVRFGGPWGARMVEFIGLRRALGVGFEFEERTLNQLDRYLKQAGVPREGPVLPTHIHEWLQGMSHVQARTRQTKRLVARQFFEHVVNLKGLPENPARLGTREPRRLKRPFLFTPSRVREILTQASELRDLPFFPHRGATFEMLFATLYCLGLRISEACGLSIDDVDLEQRVLHIREGKFHKSRLLPFGPRYRARLTQFLTLCHSHPDEEARDTPLFLGVCGKRVDRRHAGRVFRRMVRNMAFLPEPGQRAPCLHSLRHSFALHRLLRWYREGKDVRAKLPLLSAFMGHADIDSTQVYLQEGQGLLDEANVRFEAACGASFSGKEGYTRD